MYVEVKLMQGHVKKRSEGSWSLVIYLGRDEDGKKKYKWITVHGTKKQAEAELAKVLHEMNTGGYVEPTKMTFGEYLDRWLEDYAKPSLRPATVTWYKYIVTRHLKPGLGHIQLSRLTPLDLQRYYARTLESGRVIRPKKSGKEKDPGADKKEQKKSLSSASVRGQHRTIHRALEQAVKWGLVGRNVADAVDPPRPEKAKPRTLNPDQVRTFLAAAAVSRYRVLYLAAITTGMRQGELLGLRWQDVDLQAGTATVRQSLKRAGKNPIFASPKTSGSARQVALSPALVAALAEHKKAQDAEKEEAGEYYEDFDLVFAILGGRPVHALNMVKRDFKKILGDAELPPMRFHDLRHTHATLLLSQGVHPKIVQERLGHSGIGITMDTYSHVLPNMQAQAAAALDEALFAPPKKQASEQGV